MIAEIVGNVGEVLVDVGQPVAPTDAIVLLESMKMEIPVPADVAGVVSEIMVAAGDVVQEGDTIAVIDVHPHSTDRP